MALRQILTRGDGTLHKTSRPVTKFDKRLHTLLDDMLETLRDARGAGLAAPQIGVLRRVVLIEVEEGAPIELINPEIVREEGEQEGPEGCLSVPGLYGIVKRPMTVTVRAQDRHGHPITVTGEEMLARAFCHEVDHLNGRLFTELATEYLDPDQPPADEDEEESV
ncbi:MAG: peptide deformylase [Oscillospiraceae bacterium]|jgi:peptide deformylase|nr:peptide deformylase [Oscillospiraceae bacterium]